MSREPFQSETGQTIDDNFLLSSSSPLFYTVNPRPGVSLRYQEQLGAPSILKSFRDLPGCTRLSSSLSNLDNAGSGRRAQFPLLPDINHKGNMGKSLQGHHSSSKRFVRERYNPPFKLNAKIRHVYTQEVTTIEGQGQPSYHHPSQKIVSCHRQTQTDEAELFPQSKQKPEVSEETDGENEKHIVDNDAAAPGSSTPEGKTCVKTVDASTSPIPSPYFPTSGSPIESSSNPFSGCSQMTVYPPLNYVRKLEDLEKITGHIVIQRFFTRTDDAFGTWLEKQLGMTSKSVSVDTSEFENAKTAELQDDDDDDNIEKQSKDLVGDDTTVIIDNTKNVDEPQAEENQGGEISGAINNPGEGDLQAENVCQGGDDVSNGNKLDCTLADSIKCECYIGKLDKEDVEDRLKELEEQIITPDKLFQTMTSTTGESNDAEGTSTVGIEDEVETLISSSVPTKEEHQESKEKPEEDIDEMVRCTLEAYLMAPMAFEDVVDEAGDNDETAEGEIEVRSPVFKNVAHADEVDSGRAESIQSHERMGTDGMSEVEGNTSHDSVETVYEIPLISSKANSEMTLGDKLVDNEHRVLQRSISVDSCIGTESSGDAKNQTTNASQSSNDTIEGLDPVLAPKELADLSLGTPASAPLIKSKLPPISVAAKTVMLSRKLSSAKSQRSVTSGSPRDTLERVDSRRNNKTDAEAEDADGESETESEITDHFILPTKLKHHTDGTDLELEEVEEDEGDDDRDAFDAMVANHLKYSRGLPTATSRRSKLNRGTQTTKSIEPSTTSGSMSPCSSSNSSFDVEIISKSKRITTTSSSVGGGQNEQQDRITPSNMTLAWHEGGRRRSYLPSSSSSLNLLNMKFSLGKDFESEVSIRMPANKSSSNNTSSASMLLPGSGGTGGGRTLMSSSSRTHNHSLYQNRGISPSNPSSGTHSQHTTNHHQYPNHAPQSPATSANPTLPDPNELHSLWKDVKTKLDVQLDEMVSAIPEEEEEETGDLQVRGNGILPSDHLTSGSGSAVVKLKRNEERIKRSLQRLKKILDD